MTTPINDFQDILDAIERNPALRDALRRHILTDELLQMPVRLERVEEDIGVIKGDVATLKEGQARLESDVGTLKEGQARLESEHLKGGASTTGERRWHLKGGASTTGERRWHLKGGRQQNRR